MLPLASSSLAVEDNSARGVVRRALVLSNGALGAEGQCLGLVRALGLHRSKHGSGSNDVFDVRLVGDAALMMSRRLGAAWSERLSHSMGARELVKRGGPRQAPLPRYSEALAKALHRFVPVAWHVAAHALWDRVFGYHGVCDRVWLGVELAPMVNAVNEAYRVNRTRTLVVASGRGTVPSIVAMKRRCKHAAFTVHVRDPKCDARLFDMVVAPEYESSGLGLVGARGIGGDGTRETVCVTRAALHRLDAEALARAKDRWRREFSVRPGPRLVVCVGGPTRHVTLGPGWSRRDDDSSPGTRFGDEGAELKGGSSVGSLRNFLSAAERRVRGGVAAVMDWRGTRRTAAAEESFAAEVADFVTRACADPVAARRAMGKHPNEEKPFRFGSAFVTFSRRTPRSLRAAMHRHLARRMVELADIEQPHGGAAAVSMSTIVEDDEEIRRSPPPRPRHSLEEMSREIFGPKIETPSNSPSERSQSPVPLPHTPGLWVWDERGSNPYEGAMAWADAVVVTADSASTLSEATSLRVPVVVAGWRFATGAAAKLLSSLATRGAVRAMEDVTREGLDRPWVGAKALNGAFAEGGGGGGGIDGRPGEAAHEGGQLESNSYDDAEAAAASVASAVRVEAPPPRLSSCGADEDDDATPTSPLFRSVSAPPISEADPRRKLCVRGKATTHQHSPPHRLTMQLRNGVQTLDAYRPTFDPGLDVATLVFSHVQCVKTRLNLAVVSKLWRDASKPAAAYPDRFDFGAFPGMSDWTSTRGYLGMLDNDEALSLPYERVVGLLRDVGLPGAYYICNCAASRGSVRLLKWTRENNLEWSTYTCADAAANGHLPALKYLHENGCPWDEYTCSSAADNGHLPALQYLHENGCPWSPNTCYHAAYYKHWDCLQYAVDNKCPHWEWCAEYYAEHLR